MNGGSVKSIKIGIVMHNKMGMTITQDQGPAEPRGERSERPSGDKKA